MKTANGPRRRACTEALLMVVLLLATSCALSCQAEVLRFYTTLTGTAFGSGFASLQLLIATESRTAKVLSSFFVDTPTEVHFHGLTTFAYTEPAPKIMTVRKFVQDGVPVVTGQFVQGLNFSDPAAYDPAFLAANGGVDGAYNTLLAGLYDFKVYADFHTVGQPEGAVSGFLYPLDLSLGPFSGTPDPITVTIESSSAVYRNVLFLENANDGSLFLDPASSQVNNSLPAGTKLEIGTLSLDDRFHFGINVYNSAGELLHTLYSRPEKNPDGANYVKVTEPEEDVLRIAFEDRLLYQPDRPEAPNAPKDYNDLVFTVEGIRSIYNLNPLADG